MESIKEKSRFYRDLYAISIFAATCSANKANHDCSAAQSLSVLRPPVTKAPEGRPTGRGEAVETKGSLFSIVADDRIFMRFGSKLIAAHVFEDCF